MTFDRDAHGSSGANVSRSHGRAPCNGQRQRRWRMIFTGAGTRGRTRDLWFTKPLLYQLSYAG